MPLAAVHAPAPSKFTVTLTLVSFVLRSTWPILPAAARQRNMRRRAGGELG